MGHDVGVAILGMHRSGTSALAGTLKEAGLHLGHVLDGAFRLNGKGLQEAPSVLFMHEDLLERNGGSWHAPPEQVVWGRLHKAIRDLFLESRAGAGPWGFKDPRTLLTLEGWLDVAPDLRCVGVFRHPSEVAASLNHRNGFQFEKGVRLWDAYNARLLHFHETLGCPLVEFVGDAGRMADSFTRLMSALDLHGGRDLSFYERALRTHEAPADPPASSARLYGRLREAAL